MYSISWINEVSSLFIFSFWILYLPYSWDYAALNHFKKIVIWYLDTLMLRVVLKSTNSKFIQYIINFIEISIFKQQTNQWSVRWFLNEISLLLYSGKFFNSSLDVCWFWPMIDKLRDYKGWQATHCSVHTQVSNGIDIFLW